MVLPVPEQPTISHMWFETLRQVHEAGGRVVNVISSTRHATLEVPEIRGVVDRWLVPGARPDHTVYRVKTVASTIFPAGRYRSPGYQWSKNLTEEEKALIDSRATALYERHINSLPTLLQFEGNRHGTYFSRMVCWPGKYACEVNQLQERVAALRKLHDRPVSSTNVHDIVVGGEADWAEFGIRGLQVLQPTDRRSRGFPCLVHIDITVHDNELHMLAVYRHQYLITKGYGNLLGLGRLQQFLCEQTGYAMGELAVQATLADAEYGPWTKANVRKIVAEASAAAAGVAIVGAA